MDNLSARPVFYVSDGEKSLSFYTEKLGFDLHWNYAPQGRAFVFEVGLLGIQLILNETEDWTTSRVGQGRVFVGIGDDQYDAFRKHVESHGIRMEVVLWGEPTLLVRDPDGNWITFWLPDRERATLEMGQSWP